MKACTKCGIEKPLDDYYLGAKRKNGKQTRFGHCKECEKAKSKARYKADPQAHIERSIKWVDKNRKHVNLQRLAWRVGLTKEEVVALKNETICYCCGNEDQLVFDHNHTTRTFRGMICSKCNTGLGKLGDNLEGVEKAVAYLKKYDKD